MMYLLKAILGISRGALVLMLLINIGYCQTLENLRHCTTDEYTMDFYISLEVNEKVPKDTLEYYWFKAQQVYHTQGGMAGNLLHGDFSKFYPNGQLAEQGVFRAGLKNGNWHSWYPNGKIKSEHNYKKGLLTGAFYEMDEKGQISDSGKYRKGVKKLKKERVEEEVGPFEEEKKGFLKDIFKREKKEAGTEDEGEKKEKRIKIRKTAGEKEAWRLVKQQRREDRKREKEAKKD